MLKQPNFIYSQPSTFANNVPGMFYLSTTFVLSFMLSSVAPTRSSTFYTYLITKIGNGNLNSHNNSCEIFGPLRFSESQEVATVQKVIKSVHQAVSSSLIWSERVINYIADYVSPANSLTLFPIAF